MLNNVTSKCYQSAIDIHASIKTRKHRFLVFFMARSYSVPALWMTIFMIVHGNAYTQIKLSEPIFSAKSTIANYAEAGPAIVVDQFGYLPQARKIAVLRNPKQGFDASLNHEFSPTIELRKYPSNEVVMTITLQIWNKGKVDSSSGDMAYHADFSTLREVGKYYLVDPKYKHQSYVFRVGADVYKTVLKDAFRVFYYQRAGFAKRPPFADKKWQDAASHPQDKKARLYSQMQSDTTERDLSGGWYDAGDYNKYTNWTADYVIGLLSAFEENKAAWTDDFNIPESGNGIPDIIDETLYGIAWLRRMQNEDGSLLSIVGLDEASPPSDARGMSLYGNANTSATLTTAAAFAYASVVFSELADSLDGEQAVSLKNSSSDLSKRALSAWGWAQANPDVIFKNNDEASGTKGLGAGQQEVSDDRRMRKTMSAAIYLYALTQDKALHSVVDDIYPEFAELGKHRAVNAFRAEEVRDLLYFSEIPSVRKTLRQRIRSDFVHGMKNGPHNIAAQVDIRDPYLAHLQTYTWGSNAIKANQGSLFYEFALRGLRHDTELDEAQAALNYLNYIHGVNPLGKVYLSNMYHAGAENSVNEFYHAWFVDGSSRWEHALESQAGPAPGFLVGGPNPRYFWDDCCPSMCGSDENNELCGAQVLSPPANSPPQKSYMDFNTSWPINSWEVTENSNKYQTNYLRLLSKFVN
ncbi:glycoside hydrolase family 9 protein [Ningiella sp. W23]|uniref:glycoside hydrolase family 9 protein n=1 Tax=Ningiella sp. W23 TaxID=3023715 RepID=UPI0037567A14